MFKKDRISVETLIEWHSRIIASDNQTDPHKLGFRISIAVICYYLGQSWLNKHTGSVIIGKRSRFYSVIEENDTNKSQSRIQTYKLIDLGELLFNLQHIDGFDDCIARMARSNSPESELAELDAARMLFINKHGFRFVVRKQKKKEDYDFELELDDLSVCIEAKCKVDTTDPSQETVLNVVKSAREQLPADKPGIIFVKIPQSWKNKYLWQQFLLCTIIEYFNREKIKKIVSVIYYVAPYSYKEGTIIQGHDASEIYNPHNRFDASKKWRLLGRHKPLPGALDAMPAFWLRLNRFPNGLKNYEDPNIGHF
jgi:hypothetical protein